MPVLPLLVAALLAAGAPAPAGTAAPPATSPGAPPKVRRPPAASLPTAEGVLLAIDHGTHRLRLATSTGELQLAFDRNTGVTLPGGAGTVVQLLAGMKVRVGLDGDHRAAWIEAGPLPSTPAAAP
jgi:hypothetical protein